MKNQNKKIKSILPGVVIACGIFALAQNSQAADDYYVSPSGSGSACTNISPCSLATGLAQSLVDDDQLILKDGTYIGTSLTVPWSGTSGHPITIKAENDGMAVVDGEEIRTALLINGKAHIVIEGIQFKNAPEQAYGNWMYVGRISNSFNITVRRCSFHDPVQPIDGYTDNYTTLLVYNCRPADYSGSVIVEDSIVTGKMALMNLQSSEYVIIRRNYFRGSYAGVYGYNASHFIEENNIITMPESSGCDACYPNNGPKINTGTEADHNRIIGNIVLGNSAGDTHYGGYGVFSDAPHNAMNNNDFKQNVAINVEHTGIRIDTDAVGSNIENNTLVWDNNDSQFSGIYFQNLNVTISTVKNNSILGNGYGAGITKAGGSITYSFNNYFNLGSLGSGGAGQGDSFNNPSYNTATYGKGAYLMVPSALQGQGESGADIGAEVLYRYQDGVLTNERLWPWPMEDRIKNELNGISVTYSANGGLWGGTWEATKDWNEIYGGSSDATPPAAPSGLTVN